MERTFLTLYLAWEDVEMRSMMRAIGNVIIYLVILFGLSWSWAAWIASRKTNSRPSRPKRSMNG
jgi:hypothetical protein